MSKINFQAVAAAALNDIEALLQKWLPTGRRDGSEWVALNPVRDDSKPGSFKINMGTGFWSDFATGDSGGDLISLYAYLHRCSQLDAAKAIAALIGIAPGSSNWPAAGEKQKQDWEPITPVPHKAPAPPDKHYRHGKPSKRWAYRNADGELLFWVYRFDKKDGSKEILPATFCENSGRRQWRWKALLPPRPLYNLDQLAARPDAPVIVTEGEKDADAAAQLFPAHVATTSPNGSRSAAKADWSPLHGRVVIVWPDHDEAGKEYAAAVAKGLQGQAAELYQVKVPFAGSPQPGGVISPKSQIPAEGWGAADALAEGWTAEHMRQLTERDLLQPLFRTAQGKGGHGAVVLPEQVSRASQRSRDAADVGQLKAVWPDIEGGWVVSMVGVQEPGNDGKGGALITLRPVWVENCTFQVIGNRESWGVYIRFYDLGWKLRSHAFPMRRLSEQGGILGQELLDMGLPVISGKEKMLSRYLGVQATTAPHMRATSKLGWLDDDSDGPRVFVMPDQVIGDAEKIIYQADAPNMEYLAATLHARGKLADWQEQVAMRCQGNPVLMFCLALGLAPALMRFTELPSGGFHLAGGSTTGKTTALQVAVTAWGCGADPQSGPQHTAIRRWKATGNALESVAEMHNHMLLALDEINEVDPRELGGIIYALAGGQSKGRATMHGGLRAPRHWQLIYISSGERSVVDILRQAGHNLQGGQQVRLPEIPAEDPQTGAPSIIEDPQGLTPREFSEKLKHACARHYGTAGPTFVAYLIQQVIQHNQHQFTGMLRQELQKIEEALQSRIAQQGERLTDENRRALRQFALVILAGSHAHLAGILPWDITEMFAAGEVVVMRWVRDQGEERTEVERGLAHLRDAMIANAERFRDWQSPPVKGGGYQELIGFKKDDCYMLTPAQFRHLIGDYDSHQVLQALAKKGFLEHNKGRLTKRAPYMAALGTARPSLYWIKQSFLDDPTVDDGMNRPPPAAPVTDRQLGLDDDIPF